MNNFLKNKKKKTLDNDVKKENFSRMRDISEFMELCGRVFFVTLLFMNHFYSSALPGNENKLWLMARGDE